MDYFNIYREMISLRGLTDHTLTSYSTYIRSYLDYLTLFFTSCLRRSPGMNSGILSAGFRRIGPFPTVPSMPVSPSSGSSPSTCFINHGIQHSFLSGNSIPIFPLSRPKRKSILLSPPCRIQNPKRWLHSCILPASGSAKSVISVTVILSAKRCGSMLRAPKAAPTAMQSFPKKLLIFSPATGLHAAVPAAGFSRNRRTLPVPSIPFTLQDICVPMKNFSAGNTGSPAILSGMPLELTFMKTGPTCLPSKISWDTSP